MRKVKDAKDTSTNELIYFKGHAKAVYMSNGSTVEDSINSISGSYPEVNHGTEDTTFILTPNEFHIWEEVASLDLTLAAVDNLIVDEYLFQFTSGETPTTLILPDTIKWVNDFPEIESGKTYQCSIINNIGVICGV